MKRLPILATIIVALAAALMVGLGIWQLQRAQWKEGLIERYGAAARLPEIAWPSVPADPEALYYRRAAGFCTQVTGWRAVAGRNRHDQPGWSHIAACRTGGAEGPGMQVDMGWSRSHEPPSGWTGGEVHGLIAPDREHGIRLVSEAAAPGLEPSARPDPSAMPNNHMMYAFQWFFFAATAVIIYLIALRRRRRPDGQVEPPEPKA